MKIQTDRFGEIEFNEVEMLRLPEGLIGIPPFTRAVLLDHKPGSPFRWLQSVDDPAMAFVVIDPLLMVPAYPIAALRDALAQSGPRPDHVAVAAITTVPRPPAPITVNLAAPLAFDSTSRQGAQIVLDNPEFHTKHALVAAPSNPEPGTIHQETQVADGSSGCAP